MTARQEAKLNMYNAVLAYCNANSGIISSVPALQTAFSSFSGQVETLISVAQLEAQVISGVTMNKSELKDALCNQAANLAALIFAFATTGSNTVLAQQVNFPVSSLQKLRDDGLPSVCNNIIAAANDNLAALADYGVTAATISDLSDALSAYSASVPAPRNAVSQRKALKAQMKTSIKSIDDILKKQMDKLVLPFKTSNSYFYNAYISNREIMDAPTSSGGGEPVPTPTPA